MFADLSPDLIPLVAFFVGAAILVAIALFHGVTLHAVVRWCQTRERQLRERRSQPFRASALFATAVFVVLGVHVVEIVMWGACIAELGLVSTLREGLYFSGNTYTTLGYGGDPLPEGWRPVTVVMAISGLFNFAWTAGSLAAVATSHYELHDYLVSQRRDK